MKSEDKQSQEQPITKLVTAAEMESLRKHSRPFIEGAITAMDSADKAKGIEATQSMYHKIGRLLPFVAIMSFDSIERQEEIATDMRDSIKRQEVALERQERLNVQLLSYTKRLLVATIVLIVAAVLTFIAAVIPLVRCPG
jgi:hypothetical protein